MLSPRLGLSALLLLVVACTEDKKSDTPAPTISIENSASLGYAYGDFFNGYKSYRIDLSNNSLTGSWDRLSISTDPDTKPSMLTATATMQLSEDLLQAMAKLFSDLNNSIVTVDKADCGIIQDGSIESLIVTEKSTARKTRIADAKQVQSICADAYVAENSLVPVFEFLHKLLPQPEDPSAYKP